MMAEYLARDGFECHQANDPVQGIECALSGDFEAAILDIMMPGIDGIEVLRRIRQKSSLPILMLTAKGDGIDRVVGLELGADDYLAKPVLPREVVARLRAVLRRVRGQSVVTDLQKEFVFGSLRVSPVKREVHVHGKACTLTSTEFNILCELARRPEEVLTKDELSQSVLHRHRESYDRSIDIHVSNIRHKLQQLGEGIEIETVRAIGYRLRASQ